MAEDIWEEALHVASWGGLELDVVSTQDAGPRTVAIHRAVHRDGGRVEDLGGEPRQTRCRIIFFRRAPDDDPLQRFADFESLKRLGESQTFTHPITGSYEAKVSEFTFTAEAEPRDAIFVECTFVEDSEEPAVFDIGAGAPFQSSVEAVTVAANQLDATSAELGADVDGELGPDSIEAVTRWQDLEDPSALRDVNMELVALRDRIEGEMFRLELASEPGSYPLIRDLNSLSYNLRKAAEVFTERAPRLVEYRLNTPTNLMAFCQARFGAAEALDRYEEVRRLNAIPNPARIEAGAVIVTQSPNTRPKRTRTTRR